VQKRICRCPGEESTGIEVINSEGDARLSDSTGILTVDVGGTWTRVALMHGTLDLLAKETAPTPIGDIDNLVQTIYELCCKAEKSSGITASTIGLALGCAVDSETGTIIAGRKLGLSPGLDILGAVKNKFRMPAIVRTEISMAALGETLAGCAQGLSNVIVLTIGTGLGVGVIINGHLYRGSSASAGEIGHIPVVNSRDARLCSCGQRGCLEAYVTAPSLVAGTAATPEGVVQAACDGDPSAKSALLVTAGYIGLTIAICANTFDPELIVLRGGFIEAIWPLISQFALATAAERSIPHLADVRLSPLGKDGVFYGLAAEMLGSKR